MESKQYSGLTQEQVLERIAAGEVNGEQDIHTKSYGQILRDNLFTLFNLINVILLVCILLTGSLKNALFFLVVIWNFLIGSFQEIRAKKTIDKLTLLSAPKAYVLRDGEVREMQVRDIVLGDIMELKSGHQVCADAVVLDGSCQVNENLITGESTPVLKKEGDHLLSGSFLISGKVLAEVEHVGDDNYAAQITRNAKCYKKPDSVIMKSVTSIVKVLAIAMIPLAGLQVWNNFFRFPSGFSEDMIRTVASVSAMIPGGLILLVSIVLAVSVVRLSAHKTLVQDLYCVENLARVDMLLLDKTGTITEGKLTVEEVVDLADGEDDGGACADDSPGTFTDDEKKTIGDKRRSYEVHDILKYYMEVCEDENTTAIAVRSFTESYDYTDISLHNLFEKHPHSIPFSSERKWSMVEMGNRQLVLGAPENILKEKPVNLQSRINKYGEEGKRVVLLAMSGKLSDVDPENDSIIQRDEVQNTAGEDSSGSQDYQLPTGLQPMALIIIGDQVRKEAPATFDYFEQEGVSIKVVTGDSPVTASRIAEEAGLENADNWIDASEIKDEASMNALADKYTIFGRVTPDQKCQIVKALQEKGHTVAMIGDGANDVLALKEADCSVAMQNGSDAARNIANMVLLDSDFSSLPLVVKEGRKSINNLQRSSALYLTKTVYSFIFSIFFIFTAILLYPFENIQITLIGAITIGIPSFFLALEPNSTRIQNRFLWNVFKLAVPSGVLEAGALITLLYYLRSHFMIQDAEMSSAAVYLMLIIGILVIFNISGRLNVWKLLLILGLTAAAAGAVLVLPGLFSLNSVTWSIWKVILVISAVFFGTHFLICRVVLPCIEHHSVKRFFAAKNRCDRI